MPPPGLHFDVTADCAPAIAALRTINSAIDDTHGRQAAVGVMVAGHENAISQLEDVGRAASAASGALAITADTRGLAAAVSSLSELQGQVQGVSQDLDRMGSGANVGVAGGSIDGLTSSLRGMGSALSDVGGGFSTFSDHSSRVGGQMERDFGRATSSLSDHRAEVQGLAGDYRELASVGADVQNAVAGASPSGAGGMQQPSRGFTRALNQRIADQGGQFRAGFTRTEGGSGPPPTGGIGGGGGGGGDGKGGFFSDAFDSAGSLAQPMMMGTMLGGVEALLPAAGALLSIKEAMADVPQLAAASKYAMYDFKLGVDQTGQSALAPGVEGLEKLAGTLHTLGNEMGTVAAEHMGTGLAAVNDIASTATGTLKSLDPAMDSSITGLTKFADAVLNGIGNPATVQAIKTTTNALSDPKTEAGITNLISGLGTLASVAATTTTDVAGAVGNVTGMSGAEAEGPVLGGGIGALLGAKAFGKLLGGSKLAGGTAGAGILSVAAHDQEEGKDPTPGILGGTGGLLLGRALGLGPWGLALAATGEALTHDPAVVGGSTNPRESAAAGGAFGGPPPAADSRSGGLFTPDTGGIDDTGGSWRNSTMLGGLLDSLGVSRSLSGPTSERPKNLANALLDPIADAVGGGDTAPPPPAPPPPALPHTGGGMAGGPASAAEVSKLNELFQESHRAAGGDAAGAGGSGGGGGGKGGSGGAPPGMPKLPGTMTKQEQADYFAAPFAQAAGVSPVPVPLTRAGAGAGAGGGGYPIVGAQGAGTWTTGGGGESDGGGAPIVGAEGAGTWTQGDPTRLAITSNAFDQGHATATSGPAAPGTGQIGSSPLNSGPPTSGPGYGQPFAFDPNVSAAQEQAIDANNAPGAGLTYMGPALTTGPNNLSVATEFQGPQAVEGALSQLSPAQLANTGLPTAQQYAQEYTGRAPLQAPTYGPNSQFAQMQQAQTQGRTQGPQGPVTSTAGTPQGPGAPQAGPGAPQGPGTPSSAQGLGAGAGRSSLSPSPQGVPQGLGHAPSAQGLGAGAGHAGQTAQLGIGTGAGQAATQTISQLNTALTTNAQQTASARTSVQALTQSLTANAQQTAASTTNAQALAQQTTQANQSQQQSQTQQGALSQSLSGLATGAGTTSTAMTGLNQSMDNTGQSASALGQNVNSAMAPVMSMPQQANDSVGAATAGINSAGASLGAAANAQGQASMASMTAGIASGAGQAASAAASAASGAASAASGAGGTDSSSPSKKFIWVGETTGQGFVVGVNRSFGMATPAVVNGITGSLDAANGVANDAGLMVGYSYVESIVTGAQQAVKMSQFQQLGFPQIQEANAKAVLGALGLMGPAGSGAQSYQLQAQEKSFGAGVQAVPAPTPITVNVSLDGQPFDQKITTATNALLVDLAESYARQRGR